jgi:hypothetical protein
MVRLKSALPVALCLVSAGLFVPAGARAGALGATRISIGSVSVVEGDVGTHVVKFPLTLSAPSTTTVTVDYAVTGVTAKAGSDFKAKIGTITFAPNSTGFTPTTLALPVTVDADTAVEGDETFMVTLTNPTGGAVINWGIATGTVIDDDPVAGLQVAIGDASIYEGDTGSPRSVSVPVTLSAPSASTVTVPYSIAGGTAVAGVDYKANRLGKVVFKAGKVTSSIPIKVLPNVTPEPDKTIAVTLSEPTGASLGRSSATVTITNDDGSTSPYPGTTYYLALGDSAAMWNGSDSYPDQIAASPVAQNLPNLQLVNLSCSGETSDSMLNNSLCGGSQYQKAIDFLKAHPGQIALITIDIGGNDVFPCITATGFDPTCAAQTLATMQSNIATMLAGIRAAAGTSTPIIGMNYYDPLDGEWLEGAQGRSLVKALTPGLGELNGALATVYGHANVPVADVQDAFATANLKTAVQSSWGRVPIGVERACTLLDITCTVGQYEGFGDDPNLIGAGVIAETFESMIGVLSPPS